MSTLPEIAEALSIAVFRGEFEHARSLAHQAAAKMGGERGHRVSRAAERSQAMPVSYKHWEPVYEPRTPFVPAAVAEQLAAWRLEVRYQEKLLAEGERVLPLLLAGETRCGKTSLLCSLAAQLNLPVQRLSMTTVVDSHVGDTAKALKKALDEARATPGAALWLIDEIDGITATRAGGDAASQERAFTLAALLTMMESLPPGMLIAATTNALGIIDKAMSARFRVVEYPAWAALSLPQRLGFMGTHGGAYSNGLGSYAEAVQAARDSRVASLLYGLPV